MSQREEGCLVLQEALRALGAASGHSEPPSTHSRLHASPGPGNHRSCPRRDLGLLSEVSLFSPVPSSLPSGQTKLNPLPQPHSPS